MNIVIIEDEPLTSDDLARTILKLTPEAKIVAKLYSVEEAIAWFKKNEHPDLIFSDIQLGDGLCFDFFKSQPVTSPVVFCTAYDEFALTAFKANGIDYILKPFDDDAVANAIAKYKELERRFSSGNNTQFQSMLELFENRERQKKSTILVYHKDKILPVRMDDIALFYLENEITYLITFDQKSFTINKPLDELEKMAGNDFYRANRQHLINIKAIKEASQYFARTLSVTLTIPFKETIKVNKVKVPDFLNWLSGN
jgi:two-component system, LytTR family, response regulator LytT